MKRTIYILLALVMLAGCKEKGGDPVEETMTLKEKMVGEWHCSPSDIVADIFLSFTSDGSFELYQQITTGAHRLYRGTWSITDEGLGHLDGKYNDGSDWASGYVVTMDEKAEKMTITSRESADAAAQHYSRTEIPASVKENCVVEVKSN